MENEEKNMTEISTESAPPASPGQGEPEAPRCPKHPAEPQIALSGKRAGQFMGSCKICAVEQGQRRREKTKPPTPEIQAGRQAGTLTVSLDFSDYPEVLEQLREKAQGQMRSPEMQALWLLNTALSGIEQP